MIEKFTFRRVRTFDDIKPFDCADPDLNDFFHNESPHYASQLLAVTYVFENSAETISFFTVLNDTISKSSSDKNIFKRLSKAIPYKKRYHDFPAVKVGRLGVNSEYKREGIGTEMVDFIKGFFTDSNKTGCRFITVDAYNRPEVIDFYQNDKFVFLTVKDTRAETRLMYFDLMTFVR